MLYNHIIVFDLETTSIDRAICETWQLSALAIRPRDLCIYPTSFNSRMRPLEPDKVDHNSLALSHITLDEIINEPHPGEVWTQFARWASQFSLQGKTDLFSAPVAAGHNITNFDIPIYERYAYKYGIVKMDRKLKRDVPAIFSPLRHYDTMEMMGMWTENLKKPRSLSLVNLRKFFGMGQDRIDRAHDAMVDVEDTARILIKLLQLSRSLSPRIHFENCFAQ